MISDPESIITVEAVPCTALTVTGTCVARDPKKEHPGGRTINFLSSMIGAASAVLVIVWWVRAISLARQCLLCRSIQRWLQCWRF